MALKILSDPQGLVSDDPFVIELDEIYNEFHQLLEIGHPITPLEHLKLDHIHQALDRVESSITALNHEGVQSAAGTQIHQHSGIIKNAILELKHHVKTFEASFNTMVEPYNATRQSLHEDLQEINDILSHVQHKDSASAIAQRSE